MSSIVPEHVVPLEVFNSGPMTFPNLYSTNSVEAKVLAIMVSIHERVNIIYTAHIDYKEALLAVVISKDEEENLEM